MKVLICKGDSKKIEWPLIVEYLSSYDVVVEERAVPDYKTRKVIRRFCRFIVNKQYYLEVKQFFHNQGMDLKELPPEHVFGRLEKIEFLSKYSAEEIKALYKKTGNLVDIYS